MQSAIYHKGKLRNPFTRYYMIVYIVLGIAGGIVGSYFISKYGFKTEITDFDYKKLIIMSSLISAVALLSSVSTSRIANLIIKKRRQNKKM